MRLIAVRLEHRHHALPPVAAVACGADHGGDLGRQVGVVVDEGRAAVDPADVEAAGNPAEACERSGDVVERDADAQRHRRGTGRVDDVVDASQRQRDLAEMFGGPVGTTTRESESERPGGGTHVDRAHVALGADARR